MTRRSFRALVAAGSSLCWSTRADLAHVDTSTTLNKPLAAFFNASILSSLKTLLLPSPSPSPLDKDTSWTSTHPATACFNVRGPACLRTPLPLTRLLRKASPTVRVIPPREWGTNASTCCSANICPSGCCCCCSSSIPFIIMPPSNFPLVA